MARQIRKKSGTGIYYIMLRGIPLDYRGQVIGRFGKSMTCPPDLFSTSIKDNSFSSQ